MNWFIYGLGAFLTHVGLDLGVLPLTGAGAVVLAFGVVFLSMEFSR